MAQTGNTGSVIRCEFRCVWISVCVSNARKKTANTYSEITQLNGAVYRSAGRSGELQLASVGEEDKKKRGVPQQTLSSLVTRRNDMHLDRRIQRAALTDRTATPSAISGPSMCALTINNRLVAVGVDSWVYLAHLFLTPAYHWRRLLRAIVFPPISAWTLDA